MLSKLASNSQSSRLSLVGARSVAMSYHVKSDAVTGGQRQGSRLHFIGPTTA